MATGRTTGPAQSRDYLPALRFRALTPAFDAVVRATVRERTFKPALVEQAAIAPGLRVLDLGAGTGTLAIMAKQAQPQADVVGIDPDPEILEIARAKAADAGVDVTFDQGSATQLPYENASFDRVLSTLVFHHLTPGHKREALAEIARVLRPGGELHIADWTKPADVIQQTLALQTRLFDGFERTRENLAGELPRLIAAAGLGEVRESRRLRTWWGTLALVSAHAPAAA